MGLLSGQRAIDKGTAFVEGEGERFQLLLHLSHTALLIFAITASRVASSAGESETKTAMAMCLPLGSVTSPIGCSASCVHSRVPPLPLHVFCRCMCFHDVRVATAAFLTSAVTSA